jgi:hypothetical protein
MAATAEIKAVITADDRASKTLKGFSTKIGDLSVGMAALGAGAMKVADMAFDFLSQSVKKFTEAERASRMLKHAVLKVTGATKEQLEATNKLAEAISAKGVLDDDVIKQGLAQLSTFRLSNGAVQGLAQSLADLTVNQFGVSASGEQAADAANMIAKALRGEFGMLQKSGIVFTDAQKNLIQFGTESEKVAAITKGFADNLKYTNETAKGTAEGGFARMQVAIGNMQESIGGALAPALEILATKLTEFVSSDQFKAWLEKVTVWIRDELPPFIQKLFTEYIPKAKQAFDEWWPKIKATADALGDVVGAIAWVGSAIEKMSSDAGLAFGFVVMWAQSMGESIGRAIYSIMVAFGTVGRKITEFRKSVVASVGNLGSLLYGAGRDMIQGLINGIASMGGAVGDRIKGIAQGAVNAAKNILGIRSPSKVFAGIGENIGKGMVQGMESTAGLVQASMGAVASPAPAITEVAPTTAATTVNISLSGIFTGTPGEARKLATMVADNLQTLAGQKNMTVTQMLG